MDDDQAFYLYGNPERRAKLAARRAAERAAEKAKYTAGK
jgi:hypothetical protein